MDTIAEGINLLTKISSKTVNKLLGIESTLSSKNNFKGNVNSIDIKSIQPSFKNDEIKTTLQKPKPVNLVNVSKEALDDLKSIIPEPVVKEVKEPLQEEKKTNILKPIIGALAAAGATYAILDNLKPENIPGVIKGLQSGRKQLQKLKKRFKTSFKDMQKSLKNIIPKDLGDNIRDGIKKIRGNIDNGMDKLKQGFKDVSKTVKNKVSQTIDDAIKPVKDVSKTVKNKLSQTIDDIGVSVKTASKNIAGESLEKLKNTSDVLVKGVQSALQSVKSTVSGAVEKVTDTVKSITPKPTTAAAVAIPAAAPETLPKVTDKVTQVIEEAPKKGFFSKVGAGLKAAGQATKEKAVKAAQYTVEKGVRTFGGVKKVIGAVLKSPLLAPLVESVFTYKDVNKSITDFKEGKIDKKELDRKVGERSIKAIGGVIGGALGAGAGAAALGTLSFGLAAPLGAVIGGIGGDMAGRFLGKTISNVIGSNTNDFGEKIIETPIFKGKMENKPDEISSKEAPEKIEDGIITKTGKLIKPHTQDFIYALKDGGPLMEAMNRDNVLASKTQESIISSAKINQNLMNAQIKLLNENNRILKQMVDREKSSNNVISANSNTTNINYKSSGLRELQLKYA